MVATTTRVDRPSSGLESSTVNGRTHVARITPAANVAQIDLVLPRAGIDAIRIDGRALGLHALDDGRYRVRFVAPPAAGITIEVDSDARTIDATLVDEVIGLPAEAAPLVAARGRLAVPVHGGDRWITLRKVVL